MTCQELADSVTNLFDGTFSPEDERRLARHLAECVGCESYLDQFRCVIELLGELSVEIVPDEVRNACTDAFRDYLRESDPVETAQAV